MTKLRPPLPRLRQKPFGKQDCPLLYRRRGRRTAQVRVQVARVSNLLYRRFPIGRVSGLPYARPEFESSAGWKHCDTAGWKPALRRMRSMSFESEKVLPEYVHELQ
jgi:hypothetical protein